MLTLHWLPIKHRIDFKILLITYKALNGLAPQYLSELLSHYSPPRRSQNSGHLIIPRISKSTAGGRSLFYLAPKLWNKLPNNVREADTLCQFKSRLKTHLFNLAYSYTNGAFPLHGTVRFGTARYGTAQFGSVAFPPQFSTAIEWAGLFTRRYNCAASTAVTSS